MNRRRDGRRSVPRHAYGVLALAAVASCNAISGIGDLSFDGSGGESSSAHAKSSSSGHGGAASSSSVSGSSSASGGAGGSGGSTMCVPNSTMGCYSGPPATMGVGVCKAGLKTCNQAGNGYGACVGEVLPTAEDCATPVDENCDGAPNCPGTILWAKSFGTAGDQRLYATATDGAGNIIVTGAYKGQIDFGGGAFMSADPLASDVALAKFAPDGTHLWSKSFGSADEQSGVSVATDPAGNIILAGYFANTIDLGGGVLTSLGGWDIFVAKFDPAGNHVWSKAFGDPSSQFSSIVGVDSSNNIILAGAMQGTVTFSPQTTLVSNGGYDVFVTKIGGGGNVIWAKNFGDASDQFIGGLSVTPSNAFRISGDFTGSIDFGGGPMVASQGKDAYVAELGAAGEYSWSKAFGQTGDQTIHSVGFDAAGNVFISGWNAGVVDFGAGAWGTQGGNDGFIGKIQPGGAHLWSQVCGAPANQMIVGMAVDSRDNAVFTGFFEGSINCGGVLNSSGIDDVVLGKRDTNGGAIWTRLFGDSDAQRGSGVAADSLGNTVAVGYFKSTIDFGKGPLVSAGGDDAFIAKFGP